MILGLLRLAKYSLAVYAIYELSYGLWYGDKTGGRALGSLGRSFGLAGNSGGSGGQSGGSNRQGMGTGSIAGHSRQSVDAGTDNPLNMTGPGEGMVDETQDFSGESVPHKVGRGVVS
jgi:hypothetical protein